MATEVLPTKIKEWKPHPRQEEFIRLPRNVFIGFYGGAAGGGKSDVLLMIPMLKEWYKRPNFHGILFRRTFPELDESLILSTKRGIGMKDGVTGPSYRDFGGSYNEQKHEWTFPSGAVIRFAYAKQEHDVEQHDTAQFHYLGIDELTHFTHYQFSYLTSRVRSVDEDLPPTVRCASNPGNIGHGWVKEMFIDPAPPRTIIHAITPDGDVVKWIFIPSKATDNPYLMKADPGYVTRLNLLPEAERRAKLLGDWDAFAGQVFTEFRAEHHPGEPDNACHVIPAFQIPKWWPRVLALDWGYRAMTYGLWGAISPWERTYFYREYSAFKTSIEEWGRTMRMLSQEEANSIRLRVIDPSSKRQLGEPKTIKQQVEEATGWDFELADNDRVGGKLMIHRYLRWKKLPPAPLQEGFEPEVAARIFRVHGAQAYDEYKKRFEPEAEETNLPRFQIFDESVPGLGCPILVKTIPLCVYKEGVSSSTKKKEDIAEFDGDDPIDTLRYASKRVHRYFTESKNEYDRVKEMDRAIEDFKKRGNYNDLDRALDRIDREHTRATSKVFRRGDARRALLARTGGAPRRTRRGWSLHRPSY